MPINPSRTAGRQEDWNRALSRAGAPKPHNPSSVNAAPEPEEWLLLVTAFAAAWIFRARRRGGRALEAGG